MKKILIFLIAGFLLVGCDAFLGGDSTDDDSPIEDEEVEDDTVLDDEEVDETDDTEEPMVDEHVMTDLIVLVNTLNVRESPTTSSDVVTQVHLNEMYTILDESKDASQRMWYKVDVDGEVGWIAGWYIADAHLYIDELRLGYLGTMEVSDVSIGQTITSMKEELGEPDSTEIFSGALYYVYDDVTYFSNSSELDKGNIVRVSYLGSLYVYDIRLGMTIDRITGILGEYSSFEDFREDTSSELYSGSYLYIYDLGNYKLTLRFEEPDGTLLAIILDENKE